MKKKTIVALLVLIGLLTACAQATPTGAYPPPGSTSETPTAVSYPPPGSTSETPTTVAYPPPTEQSTAAPAAAAEQAAINEVSTKYSIPSDQVKVVDMKPMTWPNGCMGVVIPGVLCTNVIVNGYVFKLEANSRQFEIHTNQDGTSVIDAAQELATLRFVVRDSTQNIQVIDPNIPLGPTYNPAFNGLPPVGGSISGTAYLYDSNRSKMVAVNANGQQDLSFIQNSTYGLAIWPGGDGVLPRLAWGTQASGTDRSTSLMIANLDGSSLETLLTDNNSSTAPIQLVAEFWSSDGKSLYFSKDPVGLGGYILYGGASNLYKIDIASKEVSEVIPQAPSSGPQICLDAISGDYRYVADHCTKGAITVRDLQSGTTTTIQPPADFTNYGIMGSARFSPAGNQVVFALAKNNPEAEQGWLAIGAATGGVAKIILTSDPGYYYIVLGWLDDQTLLVQARSVGSGVNQVLTVSTDGSTITKIFDGDFLTVIDNR